MSTMRDLLTQWAKLEPEWCKIETRPNWDWHEEFEDFYIGGEAGNKDEPGYSWGWHLVFTDSEPKGYHPWESEASMRIQWAVQFCLQERGWGYIASYNPNYSPQWEVRVYTYGKGEAPETGSDYGLTEALLSAYLETLKITEGITQ